MPEALMAMTASPGPGAGSGKSRNSSVRLPRKTTPRIDSSLWCRSKRPALVPLALVDERQQRLSRLQAPEILAEGGDHPARPARRAAGRVGRDDGARVVPQRVARGQRLWIRHVEPGRPDQPLLERGHQIVAEYDGPAR